MKITLGRLKNIIRESVSDEEYSSRDEMISVYSDVYKEKYGIRPRGMSWDDVSDEDIRKELDKLYAAPNMDDDINDVAQEKLYQDMEGTANTHELDVPLEGLPTHSGMGKDRHDRARERFHGPNHLKK